MRLIVRRGHNIRGRGYKKKKRSLMGIRKETEGQAGEQEEKEDENKPCKTLR